MICVFVCLLQIDKHTLPTGSGGVENQTSPIISVSIFEADTILISATYILHCQFEMFSWLTVGAFMSLKCRLQRHRKRRCPIF